MSNISTKRKRRTVQEGLNPGERLKRHKLATDEIWHSPWGWVGTEVRNVNNISKEHILATCGLSLTSPHPFCPNKYRHRSSDHSVDPPVEPIASRADPTGDVIVISEDESPNCSKKTCRRNPNCLNYLGHEKWEYIGAWFILFLYAVVAHITLI